MPTNLNELYFICKLFSVLNLSGLTFTHTLLCVILKQMFNIWNGHYEFEIT